MAFDGVEFGKNIVEAVKAHVAREVAPLLEQISALKAEVDMLQRRPDLAEVDNRIDLAIRALPAPNEGAPGLDGKDGADGRDGEKGERGEKGDPGRDGRDADPVAPEQIADAVRAYLEVNPIPAGKDGRDGVDGKDGRDGIDGKDGAPGLNGTDGTRGERGEKGDAGADGRDGKDGLDGVGLAGALIDRGGSLVLTLTNGETRDLGLVVGRDGADGRDGEKGERGDAGKDGLQLEHFSYGLREDGRTLYIKLADAEVVCEGDIVLPAVIYRGVFRDGSYAVGDLVTWGGSLWHCDEPTSDKPGEGSKAWTLAAKRGRDGKDGKDGDRGPQGQDGKPGRDGRSY